MSDKYTISFYDANKGENYTHYVGRKSRKLNLPQSKLANPYTVKTLADIENVKKQYQDWLEDKLNDPMGDVSEEIDNLVDYLLMCGDLVIGYATKTDLVAAECIAQYTYIRAREKYLSAKNTSNGGEMVVDIETPSKGGNRASRVKELPTQQEIASEWTREKAETCTICPLCNNRKNSVWIRGEGQKGLLIIGEAPGENEDKFALPFIGKSGKMLEVMLNSIGLESQRDCWIVNSVKCRPPENRDPSATEIKKCLPYLISQILELKPKAILALGKYGSSILTGEKKFKISIHRGIVYQFDLGQYVKLDTPLIIPVVPTFHPAYLLRNPQKTMASPKYYVWKDLITVSKLLQGE